MTVSAGRVSAPCLIVGDDEPFFFAKDQQSGAPMWQPQQMPTQEGDPTKPRRKRWNDWSRGIGDSRGAFNGAVEHCENAFLGLIGRALPAHKINTVTLGHSAPICAIEEVTAPANRILCGGGTKISEINPSTYAVAATQTFGAGSVMSMQLFIDQVAIALGDSTQFYRRTAAGAYSVSTTTTDGSGDYRYARAFGLSGSDLVRGYGYKWSKCSAADFYGTNGNWTADYTIGDPTGKIEQVFCHNRWDYVLKDEGLYSFDKDTSQESNLLTDLKAFKSAENRAYAEWYDHVLVCTYAGLYRYIQQGAARPTGTEELEMNEGPLLNVYPTAVAAFGKWAYVALYKASSNTTYIAMMRRAREGDATLGAPLTITSIIDSFTGYCRVMRICTLSGSPELWYGRDVDVSYISLSRDGRPVTYRDSGTTKVWLSPTDLGSPMTVKYFRAVEVKGRNASAARTIQFKAAMDEGSLANVGSTITAFTNGFARRFWTRDSSDSGRVMQMYFEMVSNSTSTAPEVRDIILDYEERPEMVAGGVATLRFRDFDSEGDYSSRETAKQARERLESYLDGKPVNITDQYGDTWIGALSLYQGQTSWQYAGEMPQDMVQVAIRRLDYS